MPRAKPESWELQSSIYEGFSTEIWADERTPGQRTVAVVRDYKDAVKIMALREAASEVDRFMLVIESAVRNADPANRDQVMKALGDLNAALQPQT